MLTREILSRAIRWILSRGARTLRLGTAEGCTDEPPLRPSARGAAARAAHRAAALDHNGRKL